jgi:GT2 family glycosyltransferase
MNVSLIIPTYNREEHLVECLKCALKQKGLSYEIIVVDQTKNHAPSTQAFLKAHQDRIIYIFNEVPGVTKARNTGLKTAQGEVIVFIDDDTTFEDDFLLSHYQEYRDSQVSMVQGRVLEPNSKMGDRPTWLNSQLRFTGSDTCPTDGWCNSVTGCNFSLHRRVLQDVPGFDENFFGVSVREDSDFGYRAWKKGHKIKFSIKAGLFHHRHSSGGVDSGIENKFFNPSYYFCELYFAKKHFKGLVVWKYRLRLLLRGFKELKKLIRHSEAKVDSIL